jgi:hypothetical protein
MGSTSITDKPLDREALAVRYADAGITGRLELNA